MLTDVTFDTCPFSSPTISPLQTPPPQPAPWAPRPQETRRWRRGGAQGQRGCAQLLLNQIRPHLQSLTTACKDSCVPPLAFNCFVENYSPWRLCLFFLFAPNSLSRLPPFLSILFFVFYNCNAATLLTLIEVHANTNCNTNHNWPLTPCLPVN